MIILRPKPHINCYLQLTRAEVLRKYLMKQNPDTPPWVSATIHTRYTWLASNRQINDAIVSLKWQPRPTTVAVRLPLSCTPHSAGSCATLQPAGFGRPTSLWCYLTRAFVSRLGCTQSAEYFAALCTVLNAHVVLSLRLWLTFFF